MTSNRWSYLLVALCTAGIAACETSTDQGRDYSVVVVRGTVTTSAGAPMRDVNVDAIAFLVCGGAYFGSSTGVPQPRTDASGKYVLLVQSLAAPQSACVKVTGTSPTGAIAEVVLPSVEFRSLRGAVIDTVTADLVLP